MSYMRMVTGLGSIRLRFRPDAAPVTVEYIKKVINGGLYNGRSFYRSDFVIQCGLHGSGVQNTFGNLPVNETHSGVKISNTRGTAAIAHWDVPDCGNTEFFINLQENKHLDSAYGGYCVFATIDADDATSFQTVDAIAAAVKGGQNTAIERVVIE
eukprot:TRINITY_DN60295_c0_g1_i1.p1 TRINITY_DN60295_c0_g1~~TRINITY_DN60295_c0_g1_i1.p1  ORF type:complete len:155 (-),score=21.18 TRINITY_DN60295_c0_g1_i1:561-1025(-)